MIKKIPYLFVSIFFLSLTIIVINEDLTYFNTIINWPYTLLYLLIAVSFGLVFIPMRAYKITATTLLAIAFVLSFTIANGNLLSLMESIETRNYYWTHTLVDITPYDENIIMDLTQTIHSYFLTITLALFIVRIQNFLKLRIIKYFLFGTISITAAMPIIVGIYFNQIFAIAIYIPAFIALIFASAISLDDGGKWMFSSGQAKIKSMPQENTLSESKTVVQRLEKLRSLYDQGYITQEEYNEKKKDILSEF